MANPKAQTAAAAQQSMGFPPGFKTYSPFPFAGMNVQDSPIAIADQEFVYIENFLRIGAGKLRTAWDVGAAIYQAPSGLKIVSYFFYTIGTSYYVAIFLSDGSAVQVNTQSLVNTAIGPAGTFYSSVNGQLPACSQWGTLYLLISNRNTVNDYWAWDGTMLYTAGTAAPNGVTLQATGQNYGTSPTATAFGGHGSGMALTANVQDGGVVNVTITNPGTDYQVGDVVQVAFSGGGSDTSAELVATLASGQVAAASITAPGSGYTHATVGFSGGGGTGAAGSAIISSGVSSIAVTNGGTGYSSGAAVSFSGGGGTGATATAITIGGVVTEIDVTDPGVGYTSAPTVAIAGAGSSAAATASIANGQISGINITNPGANYTSAPTIALTGDGSGATAVAELSPASVSGVTVVDPGTGFVYAPNVTFVGGNGTGATGVVQLTATSIARVNVVAGGQNYAAAPAITFTGGGGGSGASGLAVLAGGQVVAVNITSGGSGYTTNVEVVFTAAKNDPGTGAGAIAIFTATTIAGVIMSNYGINYTDAPAVVISSGANHSAYAAVALMPFGVSGSSMETFSSRVWIANPAPAPFSTQPPGGNWQVTAPGSFTDFATSDGGDLFTNSDNFLQTRYSNIRQSNGYLYFFGDGSISVVSNVNTTGSPATTTFNYQNVDPQTGLSWRDAQQDFGRTLVFANETGAYALYGGSATKISAKLDQLFDDAEFPSPETDITTGSILAPSAAVATLFNVKHYLMLMTIKDPDSGVYVNKMITWNEKEWTITSQSVALTYIASQKVESKFQAWGTNGDALYPLFSAPSATLEKRLDTKYYGGSDPLKIKELYAFYVVAQDQSTNVAGVNCEIDFVVSGLAIQANVAAPNVPMPSVVNSVTVPSGASLLDGPTIFPAPAPYWPVFGTGSGGAPFTSIGCKISTTSPDFILGNLVLGYSDKVGIF